MKLIESTNKDLNWEQINKLRFSVGWCTKRGEEKWREILDKSAFVYSVYDKDKMVGMGRIVEDGIFCMFYDIVVHKDYQSQGIGKMIMNNLLAFIKDKKFSSVSLFADPNNRDFLIPFYNKFGFELFETGMRLKK
ncbi:MAG: GNAT family N-acetyltransferase [Patescibacteria group bacterium]|jgi:ribosomal protein S18 acetylase RimI-like enzyme